MQLLGLHHRWNENILCHADGRCKSNFQSIMWNLNDDDLFAVPDMQGACLCINRPDEFPISGSDLAHGSDLLFFKVRPVQPPEISIISRVAKILSCDSAGTPLKLSLYWNKEKQSARQCLTRKNKRTAILSCNSLMCVIKYISSGIFRRHRMEAKAWLSAITNYGNY